MAIGRGDLNVMVVVTDSSGSMREHGKAMLARNLMAHVREHARLGDEPWPLGESIVIAWGTEVSVVELPPEQDLPPFPVGGRAQVQPLLTALERLFPTDGLLRILLVSDGHFASSDVAAFHSWRRGNPKVSVRALAVGPDAARTTLAKLADPGGVFSPEEVVSAIASWTLPQEPALPTRLTDVVDEAAKDRR